MSSNNDRVSRFFRGNDVTTTTRRQSSDIVAIPTVEEYLKCKAEYDAWANTTKVGDALSPFVGKPFSTLFSEPTKREDGFMGLYVFPWNGGTGTGLNSYVDNSWALTNALLDVFGTNRYNWRLTKDIQARLWDPRNPNTGRVATNYYSERFYAWDWTAGRLELARQSQHEQSRWLPKHKVIRELLMALEGGYRMSVVFFDKGQLDKFQRNIIGRLDLTVAQALEARGEDWATAKAVQNLGRSNGEVPTVGVNVSGIDVAQNGRKVKVGLKNSNTVYTYDTSVTADLVKVQNAIANPARFTVELA